MNMTTEELDAIRERRNAALAGCPSSWERTDGAESYSVDHWPGHTTDGPGKRRPVALAATGDLATFIAYAPEDIAALLAEVEITRSEARTLREQRDEARAEVERLKAERDAPTSDVRARVQALNPANRFDLTERDLLLRAARGAGHGGPPRPRWAAVREVFALGSTSATALCQALGLNPDEQVGIDDGEE